MSKLNKNPVVDRSILMMPAMAAATWSRRKLITRRVMKVQPPRDGMKLAQKEETSDKKTIGEVHWVNSITGGLLIQEKVLNYFKCPYQVGQVVRVKERHWLYGEWVEDGITPTGRPAWKFHRKSPDVFYHRPGDAIPSGSMGLDWYCRPSIFMARRDSRMNLKITGVSAERVQEISEEDAKLEGIVCLGNPVIAFSYLWNSINEKRGFGWDVNPWVWVYRFAMEMVISKLERMVLDILSGKEMVHNDLLLSINNRTLRGRTAGRGTEILQFMADKGLLLQDRNESPGRYKNLPNVQTVYRVAERVRV